MHRIQEKLLNLSHQHNLSEIGYRRIGQMIGVKHPQQIKHHLTQLIKNGYLKSNKSTNILSPIKKYKLINTKFINVPVYGCANCGVATFLADNKVEGNIRVSETIIKKKKVIALRAVGNSMNKAKISGNIIEDGDYVLINIMNKQPNNGDYVLSIIDNCANIKRFIKKSPDQIALVSESTEKHNPIYISSEEDYLIGGVVINVLKKVN